MPGTAPLTYAASGVNYAEIDPFKVLAQQFAQMTDRNIARFGVQMVPWTRGESAQLYKWGTRYFGHLVEGLGTKNIIADVLSAHTGKNYYDRIAQDTVAMIVNDMCTVGAFPVSVGMHLAVGDSRWFGDVERIKALVSGWKNACDLAGCTWGGGETPVLGSIVHPTRSVISGSAFGVCIGQTVINPATIRKGDVIVLLASSGVHANGLTLARKIAERLRDGYRTPLSSGMSYGDALLAPTHIYVRAVEACIRAGVEIHGAVNITGHGWRKLMRAPGKVSYVIDKLPPAQALFEFMQEEGRMSARELYGTLNVGAGFALIMPESSLRKFRGVQKRKGWPFESFVAGSAEAGPRQVVINPVRENGGPLIFAGDTLNLR